MNSREAMAYSRRPTLKAWYCWRERHGIAVVNGLVLKADVDRAIRNGGRRRLIHPNSLANLKPLPQAEQVPGAADRGLGGDDRQLRVGQGVLNPVGDRHER